MSMTLFPPSICEPACCTIVIRIDALINVFVIIMTSLDVGSYISDAIAVWTWSLCLSADASWTTSLMWDSCRSPKFLLETWNSLLRNRLKPYEAQMCERGYGWWEGMRVLLKSMYCLLPEVGWGLQRKGPNHSKVEWVIQQSHDEIKQSKDSVSSKLMLRLAPHALAEKVSRCSLVHLRDNDYNWVSIMRVPNAMIDSVWRQILASR